MHVVQSSSRFVSCALGLAVACFVLSASTTRAQQDAIYLKTGRELRGSIIEQDPQGSVVIKLDDNTRRAIPMSEIEYVGTAGTGGVHIDAVESARISLDRKEIGRTPVDQRNLVPGPHRVYAVFDGGGSSDYVLFVQPGRMRSTYLPLPTLRRVSEQRRGMHGVFGGGAQAGSSLDEDALLGLGVHGGINFGLSSVVDLRLLGHIGLGSNIDRNELWYEVGASSSVRFNVSARYSLELGVRLGLSPRRDYDPLSNQSQQMLTPVFGIQGSLLSLRLGADRSYELTLWHALQAGSDTHASFRTGVSLTRVWP